MNGVTTIRPTMTMVRDIWGGVLSENETWILNDCAIGQTKNGRFVGLIFVNLKDFNEIYYGFIQILHPCISCRDAREKLDRACENYEALPADVFTEKVDWTHVDEGHRYI